MATSTSSPPPTKDKETTPLLPESKNEDDTSSETGLTDPKKSASALYKNVEITNPKEVNCHELVMQMRERFQKKAKKWERQAEALTRLAFCLTFTILVLQVLNMLLLAMKGIVTEPAYTIIGSFITSASALIAGLQLKLKLHEKAEKIKKGVKIYNRFLRSTSYYCMIEKTGGQPHTADTITFWKNALKTETEDIPIVRIINSA